MKPCKLLKIPIEIGAKKSKAMIDSGAEESYIKRALVEELNMDIETRAENVYRGYGNKKIEIDGEVKVKFNIEGREMQFTFNVISKSNQKSDIILGMNFLKSKSVSIDIKKRIVTIGKKGQECSEFIMNGEDEIEGFRHSNIPVYSTKNQTIKKGTNELMNICIVNHKITGAEYYFEGTENNGLTYHCGIVDNHSQQVVVENNTENNRKIKKGDKIGEISMLIEDENGDGKENNESWTLSKLKEKININEAVISVEEKEEIYKMLLSVKEALSTGDSDIGSANIKPHHIELNDYTPI